MMGFPPPSPGGQLPHALRGTTSTPRATQACTSCRRQKRRCDKRLPACSRCASLQRICDYAAEATGGGPTAEDFAALQTRLAEIEARLVGGDSGDGSNPSAAKGGAQGLPTAGRMWGSTPEDDDARLSAAMNANGLSQGPNVVTNRFPSVLFLDIDTYKFSGRLPPRPAINIPVEVLEMLDSTEVIEQVACTYFATIHNWFPFISRKRMNLGLSLAHGGPDLALLFLAMKLITTAPDLGPGSSSSAAELPLYGTTRRFMALLETAGTASILYLQAMVLVALYELGHAVYPAAWMSVGSCVRYAAMLGLPSYGEASSVLGRCTTWTEAEERRRVYWATRTLDRAISLGSKRPFADRGPAAAHAADLPAADDRAWDAGETMGPSRPGQSGSAAGASAGALARLAEASLLVDRAMEHCQRAVRGCRVGNGAGNNENNDKDSNNAATAAAGDRARAAGANGKDDGNGDDDIDVNAAQQDQRRVQGDNPTTNTNTTSLDIPSVTALLVRLSTFCHGVTDEMTAAAAHCHCHCHWALLPALCLSWSTSMMVLDLYACPEHMRPGAGDAPPPGGGGSGDGGGGGGDEVGEAERAMQVEAINGLKVAAARIRAMAVDVSRALEEADGGAGGQEGEGGVGPGRDGFFPWSELSAVGERATLDGEEYEERGGDVRMADMVSPLCLDALYCGMSTFQWLWRENGDPEMKEGLVITKRCVGRIAKRWGLAREYLEIVKMQDVEAMQATSS